MLQAQVPPAVSRDAPRVLEAQVDLLYKNAIVGFFPTFLVSLLALVALWDGVSHRALVAWLGASTSVSIVRFAGIRAYERRRTGSPVGRWRRLFILGTLASGGAWGVLGSLLFPASPLHQVILGFAVGGMVGGAAAFLSPVPLAYLTYAVAAVLPLAIRLIAVGSVAQVTMGLMSVAFIASMIAAARNMNTAIVDAIVLRIEREDLAERLRVEQERLVRKSEELASAHDAALAGTRAKSAFLATMSHEIRTPLNAVIGMAELVQQTELTPTQREYVATIRASGDDLLALVSDILDFSKLEAGKVELDIVSFDLRRCVEEAVDAVAPAAAKRGLEILCSVSPDSPSHVRSDPVRLRQVLTNLLSNAVKFTERGCIELRVEPRTPVGDHPDDEVELAVSVKDEGIGIPAAALPRLFERFTQAEAGTTRRYGGTGLGLAISKALVTMLGGTISVVSEPGRGSTFSFSVKAKVDGGAADDERARLIQSVRGARIALHVANERLRAHLGQQLAQWGADVVDGPADASIVDLGDGDERSSIAGRAGSGRLVALAPLSLAGAASADLARRVVTVVPKPVRATKLLRAVAQALRTDGELGPRSAATSTVPAAVARRTRVLVADDNEVNQIVQRRMLEQLGCVVDVVEHGAGALEELRKRRYEVVFLDLQMPVLDGLDTARRIVAEWPLAERPRLVAVTANAMPGDRERCLAAGMDDYVTKPVRSAALSAALRAGSPEPAAPIATGDDEYVDPTAIAELRDLEAKAGVAVLAELVGVFLRDAPALSNETQGALAAGDLPAAARAAHRLRGSAGTLGAFRLVTAAASLEAALRSGDAAAAGIAAALDPTLRATIAILRRLAES
jgi:signal transduction histidine kinase/CheY-like chemotaxis protein